MTAGLLSQVGAEAWELNENGITVHAGFAAYDADRRARLAGAGTDSRGGAALSAAGLPKMSSEAAREVAPGFSREEQKRLKREQAEKRNALHKELNPAKQVYGSGRGTGPRAGRTERGGRPVG